MAAKKTIHEITMQLEAGNASMMDLGKMLGHTGTNLVGIKRAYDEATQGQRGETVPVVISILDDRSFQLRLKTPPTSALIKKAMNGQKKITQAQLKAIAERKLPDLNTTDVDAAMRVIAGTARSMGVTIGDA
ncbi:50S ribosomal protein L11 [Lentzea sp. NBRC 105346]|uniref:uL11 family ribosomal protein n=1 Tax=Lentzea sp. NBRC 105346 TaxID=3032205 RepID=UPI0024A02478|nr:50S ribosomal protein L11 [Lentzea sp. NBRC 105346]GLZ32940.1 50S ribosomal protein L11 [Lentzea sp. NBRC 105346]